MISWSYFKKAESYVYDKILEWVINSLNYHTLMQSNILGDSEHEVGVFPLTLHRGVPLDGIFGAVLLMRLLAILQRAHSVGYLTPTMFTCRLHSGRVQLPINLFFSYDLNFLFNTKMFPCFMVFFYDRSFTERGK